MLSFESSQKLSEEPKKLERSELIERIDASESVSTIEVSRNKEKIAGFA